jgi:hypothetical protein
VSDTFNDKLAAAKQTPWKKLTVEERFLIADQFFMTSKELIIENAPKELSENQLKRYVYEKMYNEPPPTELWR